MDCKDIKRKIVEGSENSLSGFEEASILDHVQNCAECARFQEETMKIREYIDLAAGPALPIELDLKTRAVCHNWLDRTAALKHDTGTGIHAAIPKLIWGALFALILITGFIALPFFKELRSDGPLSYQSFFVFTLMVQNVVMLFFAPVIIRKHKTRENMIEMGTNGFNAT